MSLPKSRILSSSKGFSAAAEVRNNSPEQNTTVNINVNQSQDEPSVQASVEHSPPKIQEAPLGAIGTGSHEPSIKEPPIFERDVENSEKFSEVQHFVKSKDNLINALSLIINIIENNPLVVNKAVIADIDSLSHLISFLTEADAVDIQTSQDVDCSCVHSQKFIAVDKILITKNNETLNFKYHFADALKVLDDHHISVKFVTDNFPNV